MQTVQGVGALSGGSIFSFSPQCEKLLKTWTLNLFWNFYFDSYVALKCYLLQFISSFKSVVLIYSSYVK